MRPRVASAVRLAWHVSRGLIRDGGTLVGLGLVRVLVLA